MCISSKLKESIMGFLYVFGKSESNLPLNQETISAPVSIILQLIFFLSRIFVLSAKILQINLDSAGLNLIMPFDIIADYMVVSPVYYKFLRVLLQPTGTESVL